MEDLELFNNWITIAEEEKGKTETETLATDKSALILTPVTETT